MNKKKIEHANALRNCAKVIAWIGGIGCIVYFFVNSVNAHRETALLWEAASSTVGLALATAILYYVLVVLADISSSLAGDKETEEGADAQEEKTGKKGFWDTFTGDNGGV